MKPEDHSRAPKTISPSWVISNFHLTFWGQTGTQDVLQSAINHARCNLSLPHTCNPVTQCSCQVCYFGWHMIDFGHTSLLAWESTNTCSSHYQLPGVTVIRASAAETQRDEAASPWNQIQGWVTDKRWQGILDALVQANGLAGFDGLTVHYVRLRTDHIGGGQPLTRMSDDPISSQVMSRSWCLWYFKWIWRDWTMFTFLRTPTYFRCFIPFPKLPFHSSRSSPASYAHRQRDISQLLI